MSASGIEAAEVLPVRSSTLSVLSMGRPSRSHAASTMRMLAWCGTTWSMSAALTPAASSARCEVSTLARTARRNTSRPSIVM
jgi:hypothetical protein